MAAPSRPRQRWAKAEAKRAAEDRGALEIAPGRSRTAHQDLAGELRAPGHRGVLLVGRYLAQRFALGEGHFARQHYIELAFRRTGQLHRLVLGKCKVDEYGWIVDLDLQFLGFDGRLERQKEIERQHLVLVVEPVIRRRLAEFSLLAVGRRIGEVIVFLQR